jgi:hypothetical protein
MLQGAILVMLLGAVLMNLDYWRTQPAFDESTLQRLHADETMLTACRCGGEHTARFSCTME